MKVSDALLSKSISFLFSQSEQSDSLSYQSFTKLSVKLEDCLMVISVSFAFSVATNFSLNGSLEGYELLPFLTAS